MRPWGDRHAWVVSRTALPAATCWTGVFGHFGFGGQAARQGKSVNAIVNSLSAKYAAKSENRYRMEKAKSRLAGRPLACPRSAVATRAGSVRRDRCATLVPAIRWQQG